MIITILTDNKGSRILQGEWGLSVHIAYNGTNILMDCGQSDLFARNASVLGIDMDRVNIGVLSHAHYDHADGLDAFFGLNASAPFYLRKGAAENCFSLKNNEIRYIGPGNGILHTYSHRIRYAEGICEIASGIWLLPHTAANITDISLAAGLYIKKDGEYIPDPMEHEQTLVLDTPDGLAVFNGCCHGGAANILREVRAAFPGHRIHALIGGFHLYNASDKYILSLAEDIKSMDIRYIITGHCTGDRPFEMLKGVLGDRIRQMYCGMEIRF